LRARRFNADDGYRLVRTKALEGADGWIRHTQAISTSEASGIVEQSVRGPRGQ